MKVTPLDELRKPHPDQRLIDTQSAALLRATAQYVRGSGWEVTNRQQSGDLLKVDHPLPHESSEQTVAVTEKP